MKNLKIKEETRFLEPGLWIADTILRNHPHESQLMPPVALITEEMHGITEHQ